MRYDISKPAAPKMPILGKGTECIKILLSQASKDNYEPFVPMFFPVLGAHISGAEFQYPDNSWKEPTGMMANLVANSGDNKGQLAPLVEAICRDFRQHDKEEENKYLAWQKLEKSKGNNQAKPVEPVIAYRFPPTDTTRAGFLKNAIALDGSQSDGFGVIVNKDRCSVGITRNVDKGCCTEIKIVRAEGGVPLLNVYFLGNRLSVKH